MKSKIKNYLKFSLTLAISLLLFNCQSDTNVEDIASFEIGNNLAFKKERFQNLDKLISYVDEVKRDLKGSSLNKESSLEDTYDFIIIEDQDVLIYEEPTNTTYTIPILKSEQEVGTFSNLVVKFSVTNQTEAFIVNYDPNDGFLEAAENYEQTPFSGSITKESLQYDGSLDNLNENANPDCTTVTIMFCNWSEGNVEGDTHLAGRNCTPSFMFSVSYEACSDFPELVIPPSSTSSNQSSSSPSTSTSSGSNNNSNNNPIIIPTVPRIENTLDIDGITFDMNDWLNDNLYVKLELLTILEENPDAEDAILDAIYELMADEQLTLEEYIMMQIEYKAPTTPIDDIDEYLDCFDTSQSAHLTVYVDQPKPGEREAWTWTFDVGHAYIAITQGNITRVLGLYPTEDTVPGTNSTATAPMVYGNDEGEVSDVSITKQISGSELNAIINEIRSNTDDYNLDTNNCSTFGIRIGNLGGINLPSTQREWPGGEGNNPGDLGEDIREMTQPGTVINPNIGNASQNNGDC